MVGLVKAYGGRRAVDDVSLALEAGEALALLGPSGSGKSTLLALITGLETPDAGDIRWEGRSLQGVPTHERGFGLMFQDYALFPHRDVGENVAFGLRHGQRLRRTRAQIERGVSEALALVGLAGFERRDVNTLSGGEQQRVALARALAPHPPLLMLDEPLGALDRALRERLLDEVRGILRRLGQTAIYVTHDQEEAFAVADRVAILRAGRVAQAGTPAEVYARPRSRFVAKFLGLHNILRGQVEQRNGQLTAVTPVGALPLAPGERAPAPGAAVSVVVRPEEVAAAVDGRGDLAGEVIEKSFRGSRNVVLLRVGPQELTVAFPAAQPLPAVGETLALRLGPGAVHVLPDGADD
ncbi:MAG: ABC transporter ATP-binding protein [Anaerolineales bacterium]|nr:ABC transporter ATP-binding protein [Anaerolineales bacterium]